MIRLGLLVVAVLAFAAVMSWPEPEQREFNARRDRCTALAQSADRQERGLQGLDVGQMVEDCMDDDAPLDDLLVTK